MKLLAGYPHFYHVAVLVKDLHGRAFKLLLRGQADLADPYGQLLGIGVVGEDGDPGSGFLSALVYDLSGHGAVAVVADGHGDPLLMLIVLDLGIVSLDLFDIVDEASAVVFKAVVEGREGYRPVGQCEYRLDLTAIRSGETEAELLFSDDAVGEDLAGLDYCASLGRLGPAGIGIGK